MEINRKIKVLRLLTGRGQMDLARVLGMRAATHVNRWEQGIAIPRTKMLQTLGDVFGVYWPWIQDSTSEFVKKTYIYFGPLSPFVDYTPRWLTLLPQELAAILPEFFKELGLLDIWVLRAPCNGGCIVAAKPGLSLLITCLPPLFESIVHVLPSAQQKRISDSTFAELAFKGTGVKYVFNKCGIKCDDVEEKPSLPSVTNVSFNGYANAVADVDCEELRATIQAKINNIFSESGLSGGHVNVVITAPKSIKQFLLENIPDKNMMKLVKKMRFEAK